MCTRLVFCLLIVVSLLTWSTSALPMAAASDSAPHGQSEENGSSHGGEGGVDPLWFQRDLAIWTGVIFLVLFAVLWKFAWRPIADGLDKREKRIADEIASAEKSNEDARKLLEEYQQKLKASEDEVRQMIEAARRDAETVGHEIVEKARAEAEAEHKRKLEEIDLATAEALKELADRSATLAVELAGKIVHARLDPAAHSQLIEQAVSKFSQTEPGNN